MIKAKKKTMKNLYNDENRKGKSNNTDDNNHRLTVDNPNKIFSL